MRGRGGGHYLGLSRMAGGGSQLRAVCGGVYMPWAGSDSGGGGVGAHSCVCVGCPPWCVGLENSLSLGFRLAWVYSPLSDFPVV